MTIAEERATTNREGFDRTPPQDVAAEQSVLGGMLLSKDAIADVVEELRGNDFYRPAHEMIYEAVLDLYGRGEPADAVTVAAELTRRGEIGRIGGAPYLHTLISSVPTAANAGYYARIVREQAVLRRLVEAGTRIVQLGYATEGGDVDDLVNNAQAEVYAVTERRTSEDFVPLRDTINPTMEEIEHAADRGEGMIGVPTGFADLDGLTNGLHGGQMIIIAARPAIGKSTIALDICRSASIKHNLTSVIFSLEMGRTEITMRLLSAEAQVPLQNMRKGTMREEDWTRMATAMSRVSEAPMFIDDSPNMSLMEIRAKCRRLKQKHDLRLVVVDYLQLMSSGKRVESRQQEVSEFSRALKLLAKELEVPVIAVAQLNRGPEQRTDKKPMMSDLRESGCLTADTRIMRADTGAEVTMGELFASGETAVPVWALDERLKYVRRHITSVFSTGVKTVYRMKLASGREITATDNHPFLTYQGWKPLAELEPGSRIGVPRHVPAPSLEASWLDVRVRELAGSLMASESPSVPDDVFLLPKRQIALFLGLLANGHDGVSYSATSRALLEAVSRLLLRFGVHSELAPTSHGWHLDIPDAEDRSILSRWFTGAPARVTGQGHALPSRVGAAPWSEIGQFLQRSRTNNGEDASPAPASTLTTVVDVLDRESMDMAATNDVLWDVVLSVEIDRKEKVFDATVAGSHNFIANGIAVHNSLEQDADVVMLLHREDAYDKESPRAGEADIIVAKHRNGPTDTIVVAFQGHYSRFVDMAR